MLPPINQRPSVSVIIPSYNHAKFISEAIRSAEAQNSVSIQLIVIDDGSSDESVSVIEKALGSFSGNSCEFVVQTNAGAHAAINRGLALARGEYVQILNSDDRLHPERCARLISALQPTGHIAFSDLSIIGQHGDAAPSGHPMNVWYRSAMRAFQAEPTVGFGLLRTNAAVTTSNFLFRRSLLDLVGGFTPERLCHDWRFLLRSLVHTEPVHIKTSLLEYRFHQSNTAPKVMNLRRGEGSTAISEYFQTVHRNRPSNSRAPSPFWWPGFFEYFVHSRRPWFSSNPMSSFLPTLSNFDSRNR